MVALRSKKSGWFWGLLTRKPSKNQVRPSKAAFKVGARQSKKGSTAALQHVVLMALENEARLGK